MYLVHIVTGQESIRIKRLRKKKKKRSREHYLLDRATGQVEFQVELFFNFEVDI